MIWFEYEIHEVSNTLYLQMQYTQEDREAEKAVTCGFVTSSGTSLTWRGGTSLMVTSRLELDDDTDRQRTRPTVRDTRPISV